MVPSPASRSRREAEPSAAALGLVTDERFWHAVDHPPPPVPAGVRAPVDLEVVAERAADEPALGFAVVTEAEGVDEDRARAAGDVERGLAVAERAAAEVLVGRLADVAHEVDEVAVPRRAASARVGPPSPSVPESAK